MSHGLVADSGTELLSSDHTISVLVKLGKGLLPAILLAIVLAVVGVLLIVVAIAAVFAVFVVSRALLDGLWGLEVLDPLLMDFAGSSEDILQLEEEGGKLLV